MLRSASALLTLLLVPTLLAPAWAAPTPAPAQGPKVAMAATVEGNPAEFDKLFKQLDEGGLYALPQPQARAEVERLRTLMPPGDVHRDLLHRSLYCLLDPENATAAVTFADRGLKDARQAGDSAAEIRFRYCRGIKLQSIGQPRASLPDFEAGITPARQNRDWRLVGDGLIELGHVRSLIGEHAQALINFIEAQRLYESAGLERMARDNVLNLGVAYRRMGEYDKALQYLQQGRALAEKNQHWSSLVVALLQLGYLHDTQQQPDQAIAVYQQLLAQGDTRTSATERGLARLGIAAAQISKRQFTPALAMLDKAAADFDRADDTSNQAALDLRRAQALAGLGQHAQALEYFNRAAAQFESDAGNDRYMAWLLPDRASTLEALGQMPAALEDYKRYLKLRQQLLDDLAEQRTVVMRHQFDAARRDMENQRLTAEKDLREQELDALLKARRWQWSALGLGAVLVLLLAGLVLRQVIRMRRLRTLAMTDELTRVANRRSIELSGEDVVGRARAEKRPLTALALDIDHFKRINDVHGHHAGDRVLARVAEASQGVLRQFDQLGRIGGEEFLVLLPNTAADAGAQVAERLRECIETLDLDDIAPGLRVTISLGMGELRDSDANFKALVHRADLALYRAKANGRNRLATEDPPAPDKPDKPALHLVHSAKR